MPTLAKRLARCLTSSQYPKRVKAKQNRNKFKAVLEQLERREVFAAPSLVVDINTVQDPNSFALQTSAVTVVNNVGYFSSTTVESGQELWRTDGTSVGTYQVKDLEPGAASSSPNGFFDFQGTTFFVAVSNGNSTLFRTDGTDAGTLPIAVVTGQTPVVIGNRIYFPGYDAVHGAELWSSDGTPEGTSLVTDILPGADGSSPYGLVKQDDKLLFTAYDGGARLYALDTTTNGITLLHPALIPNSPPQPFGDVSLVHSGNSLWTTDGTPAGTQMLFDPSTGNAISAVNIVGVLESKVIIGTSYSTTSLASVSVDGVVEPLVEFPTYRAIYVSPAINGDVLLGVYDFNAGTWGMYQTDGTNAGTVPVTLPIGFVPNIEQSTDWNGSWYFPAYYAGSADLWRYAPVTASLTQVADGGPTTLGDITKPVVTPNGLYWGDNSQSQPNNTFLRRTVDGIQAETSPTVFNGLYGVRALSVWNDNVFFAGVTQEGLALRSTTGLNVASLTPVKPGITYGSIDTSDFATRPAKRNGQQYFFANSDNANGDELWRTDGTAAGTVQVADVDFGYTRQLVSTDDHVYVIGENSDGVRLWVIDEATPGVEFVMDLSDNLFSIAVLGNRMLLSGYNNTLWVSDGTPAGTSQIATFTNNLFQPVVSDGSVYFSVADITGELGVWKSDGTAEGTVLVATGLGANWYQVASDGPSIFWASSDNGYTLWRSNDGMQTREQIGESITHDVAALGGLLYFVRWMDGQHANIYRTDGSLEGPVLIGVAEDPLNFAPKLRSIGGRMTVTGIFGGQLQVWSEGLDGQFAYDPELSSFSNLSVWGDPELNGKPIAPASFFEYGSELGTVSVGTEIVISNRAIAENAAPDIVGQFTTAWNPAGGAVSFSLVAGDGDADNASFEISATGELSALAAFDSEISPTRTIRVRATNGSTILSEESISLFIRDYFDGVEQVALDGDSIAENSSAGTVIGTLSAQSLPNTTLSYAVVLVDGLATNLPFATSGNQLIVTGSLDFENSRLHRVVVRATANDGTQADQEFEVRVLNVNENAAQPISISNDRVLENEPGLVGLLSVPNTNAVWVYSIIDGQGDYDNALFSVTGEELYLSDLPDYETRDNYSVRIRAEDGTTIIEAALTIDITPVDEFEPEGFLFSYGSESDSLPFIFENVPVGQPSTRVRVIDADRGETYALTGNYSDLATIIGDAFVPTQFINYEAFPSPFGLLVDITAVSSGGRVYSRSYNTSLIRDVNDPPIVVTPKSDEDIFATLPTSFAMPIDSFIDEDQADQLSISATWNGGSLPSWLFFDESTGTFTANPVAADIGTYLITVTATDLAGATANNTFAVNILSADFVQANGTNGNDTLNVVSQNAAGTLWTVTLNGTNIFTGDLTSRAVQFFGNNGIDQIIVQGSTGQDAIGIRNNQISIGSTRIFLDGIESQDIRGRGGNDLFTISTSSASSLGRSAAPTPGISIQGGNGIDSLQITSGVNLWNITDQGSGDLNGIRFSGIENLTGGTDDDRFVFGPRGSISGTLDGGAGYNEFEYMIRNAPVQAQVNSLAPIAGNATNVNAFTNIGAIKAASNRSNTIVGPSFAAAPNGTVTWETFDGRNVLLSGTVMLTGFNQLVGSSANDEFYLSSFTDLYDVDGKGGTDKIQLQGPEPGRINLANRTGSGLSRFDKIEVFSSNFSQAELLGTNQNTQWTLGVQGEVTSSQNQVFYGFGIIQGGTGNDSFSLQPNFPGTLVVNGGGGSDSVKTLDAPETFSQAFWDLTGPGKGAVQSVFFESIENLSAGTDNDNLSFQSSLPTRAWFDSLISEADRATWVTYSAALAGSGNVIVNLRDKTAPGIRAWNNVQVFVAEIGNDRLIGRNADANWQLDMSGGYSSDGVTGFIGFETIDGGSGDDTFNLAGGPGSGPTRINGGGGTNAMVFSQFGEPVTVDLQNGTASMLTFGLSGIRNVTGSVFDDTLTGNRDNNVLYGFDGNDTLSGLQGDDVLLGGAGDDWIFGGIGNDLILGGTGADTMYGGTGDDLMIGGFSNLLVNEQQSELDSAQRQAIQAVLNEWSSNRSYAQRIARLQAGVGPGNRYKLTNATIENDASIDQAFGESGDDWFWLGTNDLAPDLNALRERVQRQA